MEGLICRFRNFVIKRAKAVTSIGAPDMGNFRPKNCANLKVFSILSHVGTDPGESKCRNRDFVRRNFSHSCKGGQTSTKGDRPPGRRKCLKQYVIGVCPRVIGVCPRVHVFPKIKKATRLFAACNNGKSLSGFSCVGGFDCGVPVHNVNVNIQIQGEYILHGDRVNDNNAAFAKSVILL